ncbi:MAG: chemotaxis protein CheW [Thermoanaerobaculia bacterium]|nr:chemotaxis protein CheW [Thermoanaerobaculia bacterium]
MTEENDGKTTDRTEPAPEEAPKGPDRVLRFADEMETREEVEEERQELETWVTCRIDEEIFALTVDQVQEILRVGELTRVPHAPFPVRGVTNMRGQVLPVVDLRRRLGLPEIEIGEDHRIMVVDSRNRLIGLLVDRVEEVTEIDRLKIEDPPEDVMTEQSYYLVGVIHRGEDLIILLDADRVLEVRDGDEPRGEESEGGSEEENEEDEA